MNSFFLVLIKRRCLPGASIRCAGVTEWVFRELFYSPFCCYAVLFSMSVMQVGIYGLLSWNKGAGLYSFGLYLSQIWVWIMVSLNYSKSRPQVLGTLIKYSSGTRLSAARGGRGIVRGAPLGQSPVLSARSLRAALLSCLSLGMWACLFWALTGAQLVSSVVFPMLSLHGHFPSFCSLPPQCPCSIIFINWLTALIDPTNLYLTLMSVFK